MTSIYYTIEKKREMRKEKKRKKIRQKNRREKENRKFDLKVYTSYKLNTL